MLLLYMANMNLQQALTKITLFIFKKIDKILTFNYRFRIIVVINTILR